MGMPDPQAVTTSEELLALPDDGLRHELRDGERVVTPAPSWALRSTSSTGGAARGHRGPGRRRVGTST